MREVRRASCGAIACSAALLAASGVQAQSSADLGARLRIDGSSSDFTAVEACFRTPDVCAMLPGGPTCVAPEESPADGRGGGAHDVRQIHVTWDARALYVAVDAACDGGATLVLLDTGPG